MRWGEGGEGVGRGGGEELEEEEEKDDWESGNCAGWVVGYVT